tara:strand:- start:9085 stop:10002 length:918 start_codon:yes stop_codon:yes gene_type:complete
MNPKMISNSSPNNSEITTALGEEGLGQEQPWWVEQWMELINSYRFKKRLERAWSYAKEGNVTSIRFEGRRVHARVQGTDEDPYKVKLWLDVLNDDDWKYVLEALTQKARWSAQLLAGVMPRDIERAFAASGRRLFPFKLQEVRSECSCPDKANPCKHISAIYFLMGERFKEDPFVLFQLRGRSREKLLADLAELRRDVLSALSKNDSKENNESIRTINEFDKPLSPHPAIIDPKLWWKYEGHLNADLVVITPSIDGETGLNAAGSLPIADEPQFPNAQQKFLNHLDQHASKFAQKAMEQAMTAGS